MHRTALKMIGVLWAACLTGCQSPEKAPPTPSSETVNERHAALFGAADLPRKIGSVESVGLNIPAISPDGRQMLYLRTDRDTLSAATLWGSPDPRDTPSEGLLSIWVRPTEGNDSGRRLSRQRWVHSPIWSESGRAVVYTVNEPPQSSIVHLALETGKETLLGVKGQINCLPRFDGDDESVLFCAGPKVDGPFRIYRQRTGEAHPAALSPPGPDCFLPVASCRDGSVLCAQTEGEHLIWVKSHSSGTTRAVPQWGLSTRAAALQTWAGITTPLSPDRASVLFHDLAQERICALHIAEQVVRRHRPRSIAGCWLDSQSIALATADGVFAINATTGMSISLFSGQWIPCRYVPSTRRLILLGYQTPRRFAVWEIVFKSAMGSQRTVELPAEVGKQRQPTTVAESGT